MPLSKKPRSLKIVSLDGARLVAENLKELRKELRQYGDKPVAVVSVAGKMRGGKSYLLNNLIGQMEKKEISRDEGFKFQGDTLRCTTGIDVWSKPYEVDGKDMVVLFMDTQGVFDQDQTIAGEANLVALSILLSSVQIFNTKGLVDANEKSYLDVYMQLAKEAEKDGSDKTFQKLVFVIRDFFEVKGVIGMDDGEVFLRERIKPSDELNKSFQLIKCHLLPFPGTAFLKNENFNKDKDFVDFKTRITDFSAVTLEPANLVPKMFNGKPVTCLELVNFLEKLVEWFNSADATKVKTPHQAMADARINSYLKSLIEIYKKRMGEPGVRADKSKLVDSHKETMNVVVPKFDECFAKGSEDLFENSKKELLRYCQTQFDTFSSELERQQEIIDRKAKETAFALFERAMTRFAEIRTVDGLLTVFDKLKGSAVDSYANRPVIFDDALTGPEFLAKLEEEMKKKLKDIVLVVKAHEKTDKVQKMHENLQLAKNEYDRLMDSDGNLAKKHSKAWEAASAIFNNSPKEPHDLFDECRQKLTVYSNDQLKKLEKEAKDRKAHEEALQQQKDEHKRALEREREYRRSEAESYERRLSEQRTQQSPTSSDDKKIVMPPVSPSPPSLLLPSLPSSVFNILLGRKNGGCF